MPTTPILPDLTTVTELLSMTELALGPTPYSLPVDWPGIVQAAQELVSITERRHRQQAPAMTEVWQEACRLLGQRAASVAVILRAVDDVLDPSLATESESLQSTIRAVANGHLTLAEQADFLRDSVVHHRDPELNTNSKFRLPSLALLHDLLGQVDAYWSPEHARSGWPGAILEARRVVCVERGISDDTWDAAAASLGLHTAAAAVVMAAARYCLGAASSPDRSVRSLSGRHAGRVLDFDLALKRLLTEVRLAQTSPDTPATLRLPSIEQVRALYLHASTTFHPQPGSTTAPIHPELRHRDPDSNEWDWLLLIDWTRRQYSALHPNAADDYRHTLRAIGPHAATVLALLAQCRHPGDANDARGSFLNRTLRVASSGPLNLSEVVQDELRHIQSPAGSNPSRFEPGPRLKDLKALLPDHVWFPPAGDLPQSWGWIAIVDEVPRLATALSIEPDTLGAARDELTEEELASALLFASSGPSFAANKTPSLYLELAIGRSQRIPARTMRTDIRLVTDLIDNELMRVATFAAPGSTICPDAIPTIDQAFKLLPALLFNHLHELGLYPPRPDLPELLETIASLIRERGHPISEDSWRRAVHILGPRGGGVAGILLAKLIPDRPERQTGPHEETLDTYLTSLVCGEITEPGHLSREIETALDLLGFFELGDAFWPLVTTARAKHDPANPRQEQGPEI